jgi:mono/diheme cytochrome c family protein
MKNSTATKLFALVFGASLSMALASAQAATLGDPKAGQEFAQTHCASCHSIEPDGNKSPVNEATPFQAVADTGGITRTALIVFFRSPHVTMPNLIVRGDDVDNVIAYILSLKKKKP